MNPSPGERQLQVRRAPGKAAFTLSELLLVIGLILLIAVMATPRITDLQSSYQLTRASSLLKDQLNFARQLAMTQNRSISVSFCKMPSPGSDEATFQLIQIEAHRPDGTLEPVANPIFLPTGISISADEDWSSLMKLPKELARFRSQDNIECRRIVYRPTGRTNLSENQFFTLYPSYRSAEPDKSFITLAIDPMTGRISLFQP